MPHPLSPLPPPPFLPGSHSLGFVGWVCWPIFAVVIESSIWGGRAHRPPLAAILNLKSRARALMDTASRGGRQEVSPSSTASVLAASSLGASYVRGSSLVPKEGETFISSSQRTKIRLENM